MNTNDTDILPVEDNPGGVRLTREALADGNVRSGLRVVALPLH